MSKRFVNIWFPYLVTDCFTISKPTLKGMAFVVSAAAHGRMIVTAANALAEAKGIYKGMSLADARAIYPALQVVNDKPGLSGKILLRIAQWCIRFTPVAAVDPAGGIMLEATGCAHLWGGDKEYLGEIIKRIREKGFYVKAAMADTIGAAWAVARFRKRSCVIHENKHLEALETLPVEALRIEAGIADRLHALGLNHIRDLLGMKNTSLSRRFGKEILLRIHQAIGTEEEFLQPVHTIEPYQERLPCLEPIQRIEGIEIALQQLLETLCLKLRKEGKGIREVILKCYRVDGKEAKVNISTSAASTNTKHLFKLFEPKLCTIEPALGIELFILDANKTEDYSPAQEAFWKQAAGIHDPRISELIDRIAGKVGMNAIYRFLPAEHYLPERSFQKTTSLKESPATSWRPERPRPIQLLPTPQKIEVTAPVPDYPPLNFRYKGKLHKIIKADGPERIEQEWWINEGRHRDYYAVQDEDGCRYWLFRSGHYDAAKTYAWYLHGFFA